MAYLDKNGLQTLTNKLVQGEAIKVASHRGHTVKNVVDNITRECENVVTPNTMVIENNVSEFKVGQGKNIDVSGDVEEGKVEVELKGRTFQNLIPSFSSNKWHLGDYGTVKDNTVIINKNNTISSSMVVLGKEKLTLFKPNTKYTAIAKIKNNTLNGSFNLIHSYSDIFLGKTAVTVPRGFNGIYVKTFISLESTPNVRQEINITTYTVGSVEISDFMILEGDYTQTPIEELPDFFEGIKSSFEDGVVDVEVIEHDNPNNKKKISFNIGEPLRSLPNGVCDEIVNNNGQWQLIRKIGKIILDGNEVWLPKRSFDSSVQYIACTHPKLKMLEKTPIPRDNQICTSFKIDNPYENALNCLWALCYDGGTQEIRLALNTTETTIEQFKNWLKSNPTTIYYELATPIITPIEPIEFDIKPLSTMSIKSDIAPTSTHSVVLNRAGQIERGILEIAELKKRVDDLETAYDNYLLETQHKLSILGLEYELESEEI